MLTMLAMLVIFRLSGMEVHQTNLVTQYSYYFEIVQFTWLKGQLKLVIFQYSWSGFPVLKKNASE